MKVSKTLFLGLGLVLLGGLFLLFRPPASPPTAPIDVARQDVPAAVEFVVAGGQRVSGPAVIEARQGDVVRLVVSADRNDELHLHGYELSLPVAAGQAARLEFEATRSGRFELELHRAHVDLAVIEVRPR